MIGDWENVALYLLLSGLVGVLFAHSLAKKYWLIVFIGVLAIHPTYTALKTPVQDYQSVDRILKKLSPGSTLICDQALAYGFDIHFGFKKQDISVSSMVETANIKPGAYIMLRHPSNLTTGEMDFIKKMESEDFTLVEQFNHVKLLRFNLDSR